MHIQSWLFLFFITHKQVSANSRILNETETVYRIKFESAAESKMTKGFNCLKRLCSEHIIMKNQIKGIFLRLTNADLSA